jgi:hypothetical protein
LNLVKIHADTFENFHGLPAKKAMLDAINLRERSFAQEAFHFVRIANHLAIFEQAHKLETTCAASYVKRRNQQTSKTPISAARQFRHLIPFEAERGSSVLRLKKKGASLLTRL